MSRAAERDLATVRPGAPRPRDPVGAIAVGAVLGDRYRVLGRLGAGGMGQVYRARDTMLGADVALKLIVDPDPSLLEYLREEARIARLVTHPNVCRLHDLEATEDGWFLTMELVEGESLAERLARGRPDDAEAYAILRGIAAGLAAAHAAGVIHRDLKPSNVLLALDGRAVVADFGIAGDPRRLAEVSSTIAGTSGYMAPEQARGEDVDARADVHAFGVLAAEVSAAPALAPLITSCRADDPQGRPADGAALVRALDALAQADALQPARTSPGAALPAAPPARPRPRDARRRRVVAAIVAAAVVIVIVVVAVAVAVGRAPSTHPDEAGAPGAYASAGAGVPPRIWIAPTDTSALPAGQAWLAAAFDRALVDALADNYALDATLGAPPANTQGADALVVHVHLARTATDQLAIAAGDVGPQPITAGDVHDLALAASRAVAVRDVGVAQLAPTDAALRAAGAHDAGAWRLWRRAQREALMQRWEHVGPLCEQALARDPAFALARFEEALVSDAADPAQRTVIEVARQLSADATLAPVWRGVGDIVLAMAVGDASRAQALLATLRARPDVDRYTRRYLDVRWAIARRGEGKAAAATMLALVDAYPHDGAAPKLLAALYASSEAPDDDALAARYAALAMALAPDDAGSRALAGLASVRAGSFAEAASRAAEIAVLPSDEQRLARHWLFELHLALHDDAAADDDARRQLTGTPFEQAWGLGETALLDLHWGQLGAAYDALDASAVAFERAGAVQGAGEMRYRHAHAAWLLGDLPRARRYFEAVAAGTSTYAAPAAALARIVAGDLGGARARTDALPAGSPGRLLVEVKLAVAQHRDDDAIAAADRFALASTGLDAALDRAGALERRGRRGDAIAALTRLVRAPAGYTQPVEVALAWSRLVALADAAGDRASAREAATELVRLWDRAEGRPEVARARAVLDRPAPR